jgi:hypothetical protein
LVKIAHVASLEWVQSGKFGVEVARNRGLDAKNFNSEPEALKWLLEEPGRQPSAAAQKDRLTNYHPATVLRKLQSD